jgi:hypothetical protein
LSFQAKLRHPEEGEKIAVVRKRQDPPAPIAWAGSTRCPDEQLGDAPLVGGVHREHTATRAREPCRTMLM